MAGKIPFAAAKAPALTKLRKCVTGDKIVLAIYDVALGYSTKLSYILPSIPEPCVVNEVCSIASAIPGLAKNGLATSPKGLLEPDAMFTFKVCAGSIGCILL